MNDDQLNVELKALFERETVVVDERGATLLLDEITSAPVTDAQPPSPQPSHTFDAGDVFDGEPDTAPNRAGFLVAAAVALVALLAGGIWIAAAEDDSPVSSEDLPGQRDDGADVNGGAEIIPDGFIDGPTQPLVIIDSSGFGRAPFDSCFSALYEPGEEGSAHVAFATGIESDISSVDFWVLEDEVTTLTCLFDPSGGSAGSQRPSVRGVSSDTPVVLNYATIFNSEPRSITGQLSGDVVQIRLVDVPPELQEFEIIGGWFQIVAESNSSAIEIEMSDGRIIETDLLDLPSLEMRSLPSLDIPSLDSSIGCPDDFCAPNEFSLPPAYSSFRCGDVACVTDELADLEAAASETGRNRQAAFLESGVLSQAEYDAAEESFLACLGSNTDLPLDEVTVIEVGSSEEATSELSEVLDCYAGEIAFLDTARRIQNALFAEDR